MKRASHTRRTPLPLKLSTIEIEHIQMLINACQWYQGNREQWDARNVRIIATLKGATKPITR